MRSRCYTRRTDVLLLACVCSLPSTGGPLFLLFPLDARPGRVDIIFSNVSLDITEQWSLRKRARVRARTAVYVCTVRVRRSTCLRARRIVIARRRHVHLIGVKYGYWSDRYASMCQLHAESSPFGWRPRGPRARLKRHRRRVHVAFVVRRVWRVRGDVAYCPPSPSPVGVVSDRRSNWRSLVRSGKPAPCRVPPICDHDGHTHRTPIITAKCNALVNNYKRNAKHKCARKTVCLHRNPVHCFHIANRLMPFKKYRD